MILQATMKMWCKNSHGNSRQMSNQSQYSPAWEVQYSDSSGGSTTCECLLSAQRHLRLQKSRKNMSSYQREIHLCSSMQLISYYRQILAVWSGWSSMYSQTYSVPRIRKGLRCVVVHCGDV